MFKINSVAGLIILCLIDLNTRLELSSIVNIDLEGKNREDAELSPLVDFKEEKNDYKTQREKLIDKSISNIINQNIPNFPYLLDLIVEIYI